MYSLTVYCIFISYMNKFLFKPNINSEFRTKYASWQKSCSSVKKQQQKTPTFLCVGRPQPAEWSWLSDRLSLLVLIVVKVTIPGEDPIMRGRRKDAATPSTEQTPNMKKGQRVMEETCRVVKER